jgi:hypothetical protein
MTQHHVDPTNPPTQPPPDVRQPLMWWMGVRLVVDHQPWRPVAPWQVNPRCRNCGRIWPCPGHRLGIRGLAISRQDPEGS